MTNKPFLLKPAGKDYLWGGERLKDDYSKDFDFSPLAETWECSTHDDGLSVVASGEAAGRTLKEVLKENPDFIGTAYKNPDGELPILIKFIDAAKPLSVQVHPSDEYAAEKEGGQRGKSEMWYVMEATEDASLFYGFSHKITKETVRKNIESPNFVRYLQKVRVKKNDVFYIPSGTVHAIGAGCLIAEIQESSNLTYRLYDYGRVGKDGKPRELHLEKALDVANLDEAGDVRQPIRVLRFRPGYASEQICQCKYFKTERILLNTESCKNLAAIQQKETSFQVLLCMGGCGSLSFGRGLEEDGFNFFKGDCIFIPAGSGEVKLHGKAEFLLIGV